MRYFVLALLVSVSAYGLRVENDFEKVPKGETANIKKLIGLIKANLGRVRDAHAKAHGCVDGVSVAIRKDLPKDLQIGYFSKPGHIYENAIIRLSPGPGDPNAPDYEPGGHGFALKIPLSKKQRKELLPVFGEDQSFAPKKSFKTFDIVTINRIQEFFVNKVDDYFDFFIASGTAGAVTKQLKKAGKEAVEKAIAAGASKEDIAKIIADTKKKIVEARGKIMKEKYIAVEGKPVRAREAKLLAVMGQAYVKNPFWETYGSWVPSLYGKDAVKYQLRPCKGVNPDKYEVPQGIDSKGDPNFIRKVVKHELRKGPQCMKLNVQFHVDGMPSIEDAAHAWPVTKDTPYIEVATITIPQKKKDSELVKDGLCERMSFNPAHASKDHYPIGGIQRARAGGIDGEEEYTGIYAAIHKQRNINRLEAQKAKLEKRLKKIQEKLENSSK